jgi:hypothetical protein
MTNLLTVSAQPWVERLGVTLLHFLWQGVLIALIYAAIRHCLTRVATPHVNYLLACAALSIMGLAPVLTFTLLAPLPLSPASAAAAIAVPPVWSAGPAAAQLSPALVSSISHTAPPLSFLQCVVAFWLIGAMALSLRVIAPRLTAGSRLSTGSKFACASLVPFACSSPRWSKHPPSWAGCGPWYWSP